MLKCAKVQFKRGIWLICAVEVVLCWPEEGSWDFKIHVHL